MIRSESRYYNESSGYIDTFAVPAFSEIKKIFIADGYIYMVIEHPDDAIDNEKLINLIVQSQRSPMNESGYQYFDTQLVTKSELFNQSTGTNLQINIINKELTYHFFIQEIKPVRELRDNKIENIITND
jgi:hypothetical protein